MLDFVDVIVVVVVVVVGSSSSSSSSSRARPHILKPTPLQLEKGLCGCTFCVFLCCWVVAFAVAGLLRVLLLCCCLLLVAGQAVVCGHLIFVVISLNSGVHAL